MLCGGPTGCFHVFVLHQGAIYESPGTIALPFGCWHALECICAARDLHVRNFGCESHECESVTIDAGL